LWTGRRVEVSWIGSRGGIVWRRRGCVWQRRWRGIVVWWEISVWVVI
jgi:hypothetical protein